MHKFLLIVATLTLATPVLPQEPPKAGQPLTKEQIERLEGGFNAREELDSLKKSMDAIIRKRGINCIKAFGHDRFCKCLNENLSVGLTFQDYVGVITNTKDELNYVSLSTEQKKMVDNAIKTRDQCVAIVFARQ